MATTPTPLRLDLVIRTSQRKKDAQSPAQQRQQADMVCGPGGHTIVAVHDSAQSESGKTMERAALHAVRSRVRAGETDGIVVGYLDRLGRAPIEESMGFVRELVGDGGVLVAADWGPDPIDLTDSNTEDMLVFRMQMNRSQWNKAAERYRLSQRNAVTAGKHVGPTPLGYVRRAGKLYEHPTYGPIVTEVFRIAAVEGLHAAIDFLRVKVPVRPVVGRRKSSADPWTTDSVRKLLRSRTYLGESRTGVLHNGDAHEPLTTLAVWMAAQTTPKQRRPSVDYPLSGIARCATCEGPLVGQLQQVRDYAYRRMRCTNQACSTGCSINHDKLENYVKSRLREALANSDVRDSFRPNGVGDAREALDQAKAELIAYMSNPALSALGDAFVAGAEMRRRAVSDTEAAYTKLAGQDARSELLPSVDELDDPAKFAAALRTMLSRIVVHPGQRGPRVPVEFRATLLALNDGDEMAWPFPA